MPIASQQTRAKAIAACRKGKLARKQIAEVFEVHPSTLYRWLADERESGRTAPMPRGHRKPALDEKQTRALEAAVEKNNDWTLEQLREQTGSSCSISSLWRALQRQGWRLKKNSARERTRPRRRPDRQ